MTRRAPATVWILAIVTLGIYALIWFYKTKEEMKQKFGAKIPSLILVIIPIANLYFLWQWAGGVEKASGGKYSQGIAFVLVLLVPFFFGAWIIQGAFNEASDKGVGLPVAQAL